MQIQIDTQALDSNQITIDIPGKENFQIFSQSQRTSYQNINGVTTAQSIYTLDMRPLKVGKFALGPITINTLSAANSVLIPIQCEFFALEGLAQLLKTIELVRQTINRQLKIKGFLPTMYSSNNNLAKQVFADLAKHFEAKLFKLTDSSYVVIPRNIKLAESPSFGKPIMLYDATAIGTKAYTNLAKAILRG